MTSLAHYRFFCIFAAHIHNKEQMEIVIEFLKDLLGSNAFIGGVVCVFIVFAAWWARGIKEKVSKIDDHEQHMNEFAEAVAKLNNLPCTNHEHSIGRHDQESRNIENRMTKVETSVEYLQRSLDSLTKGLQGNNGLILDSYTYSHSPLAISEKGQEMIERLGLQQMFNGNWERINKLIEKGVEEKNAYDIDQFCMEQAVVFPEKFLTKEQINILKADAYKEGLSLTSYMKVVAVLARNRYFEVHHISPDF